MLNHQFLSEFSQNFITQVQRILNIDGYLSYSIDNIYHTHNYHAVNITKNSIDEYLNYGIQNDPVSFKRFYSDMDNHVELLSQHNCSERYTDFTERWKIQDTAEIFFRKRNGDPIFGLSIVREKQKTEFTPFDQNILESFYQLSEKYFLHHVDTLDKAYLSASYNLTKQEIIVLEHLLNGVTNSSIAVQLNCSLATIKTHIQHIYQKINVVSRQELICKFLR